MNNKKMVILKKSIDGRLRELQDNIFADIEKIKQIKQYELENKVTLISFYYHDGVKKVTVSLEEMELRCKRRQILYRDIRYDIIQMTITEEYKQPEEQYGFVAFTNENKWMKPIFAYNQFPKITGTMPVDKYSWKVMDIGDYFRAEPTNHTLYYDVNYALIIIDISERIPKTVFKDIKQDLHDLYQ